VAEFCVAFLERRWGLGARQRLLDELRMERFGS
jgi:hypothetical protein